MEREKEVGKKITSVGDILNETIACEKPRFYDSGNLHELLCFRYNLSRHTKTQKLIDLVVEELNI